MQPYFGSNAAHGGSWSAALSLKTYTEALEPGPTRHNSMLYRCMRAAAAADNFADNVNISYLILRYDSQIARRMALPTRKRDDGIVYVSTAAAGNVGYLGAAAFFFFFFFYT